MEEMNVVLAALDLDAGCGVVLSRAAQVASLRAARLIVLHVIDAEHGSAAVSPARAGKDDPPEQLRRQAVAAIDTLVIESGRGPDTSVRVEFGQPHEVITRVACEQGAGVIVVGPGKGLTIRNRLLGSTADRVIRTAPAPVLVVRKASDMPYRKVAVALDGSPQSASAFAAARRLAPGADFKLLHAVAIPLPFQQALLRAGTAQGEILQYRAARAAAARKEICAFQRAHPDMSGLPVELLDGEPGPALVRFSRDGPVDLLALGTHGRNAAMQALLGSVARQVLDEAACDVIVANSKS